MGASCTALSYSSPARKWFLHRGRKAGVRQVGVEYPENINKVEGKQGEAIRRGPQSDTASRGQQCHLYTGHRQAEDAQTRAGPSLETHTAHRAKKALP